MKRLKVFIDYQNVYHLARRAFAPLSPPSSTGQIHPERVGELIRARRNQTYKGTPHEAELIEVRVYRGMPDGAMDPKGHAAASRQMAHWERHADVKAFHHPIAYPRGWENQLERGRIVASGEKPREKGIDVQIAVDVVVGAVQDEYDVGVIFSGDSDLLPAIRAAVVLGKHIEVAAWSPDDQRATRIPPRDMPIGADGRPRQLWCHFLGPEDFRFCRDDTDYARPQPTD